MLASLNIVMIQVVLDIVMSSSETQKTTIVHAMLPAMTEMTTVQMHRNFVYVSKHQTNKGESLYSFVDKLCMGDL